MFLIPYRKFEVHSSALQSDFAACLQVVTGGHGTRALGSGPLFVGTVGADSFHVVRVIAGRNTYRPELHGRIVPTDRGASIIVTATIHPIAVALMLAFSISGELLAIRREGSVNFVFLGLVLVAHALFCKFGFSPEVDCAEEELRQLARQAERQGRSEHDAALGPHD